MTHLGRSRVVEQVGHDALNAFERVGNSTRLLENFFLHVVAVRAQLGCAAVGIHRQHLALHQLVLGIEHLEAVQLHIHHITFSQVHDLIGHTRQSHGVTGQEVLALAFAKNQW